MIAIIDYGAGNLRSVANAVSRLGYRAAVASRPGDLQSAEAIILPGVGAAGDTMSSLDRTGLSGALRRAAAEGLPLLAVCVGMQVLFDETEEGGRHRCLGIIPGRVKRLPPGLKVPHTGWNQVHQRLHHPVFESIPSGTNFYFVHSYYAEPDDPGVVAATTEYGSPFCSVLISGNLMGTQFHPEKSGEDGLRVYRNFLRMISDSRERQPGGRAVP